ncbi:hypothetical protein WT25_16285 [Burkholderia territorii]|uniref:helix-turn-helix domain-containing protein n=1 Tax=Burkholderia territorii TaxID=1503055 RepID=UPI00075BD0FF|nr:cupin domain-containing protein [Burkholderia territorii]KVT81256.1 hypothetical protein WT25_16285 [Burkholderia territorii]
MKSKTIDTQSIFSVGGKIRSLRRRQARTLNDIATAAGLSKPFLSQVERGLASPSITSLVSIAKALGVPVNYFFEAPTEDSGVRRYKNLQFFALANSANLFGRLSNQSSDRLLEAVLVRIPPGDRPAEVTSHAGEEFVHVLSGEMTITQEGRSFVLGPGDSAHYLSTMPHSWSNARDDEEAVLVWVGTSRLF